jgi:hypothetical protein
MTSVPELHPSDFWQEIGDLWGRATGGGEVAAKPGEVTDGLGVTQRAPGVQAAADWFTAAVRREGIPKFLFLVGGPGAGKSHTAAAIVQEFEEVNLRSKKLAHRRYTYATPYRELVLINDATIGSEDHPTGALRADITSALESGSHLLACINRGVLVEELATDDGTTSGLSPANVLIDWIHRANGSEVSGSRAAWSMKTEPNASDYIRGATLLHDDTTVAQVLVVFADVCSLIERSPNVHIAQQDEDGFDLAAETYSVEEFTARQTFSEVSTPAASLFTAVVSRFEDVTNPDVDDSFNPILANARSLNSPEVRNGVLSILRAAEIASSQRLTFRELWGAIARCFVANLTDQINSDQIQAHIALLRPVGSGAAERFREMRRLGDLRFSQGVFGASGNSLHRAKDSRNPVTRITALIDPIRDATPGRFDRAIDSGWASPVHDAFAGHVDSGSPLAELLKDLGEDDPVCSAITSFDRELDQAYVEAARDDSLKDSERSDNISWYGSYLLRLYACANGIPAFRREIATWTLAWFLSPTLPGNLDEQLRTLLKPSRYPDKGNPVSLIPVFESRTDPIVGAVDAPKIALKAGSIEMRTSAQSDALFLILEESNREIPPIVLDFPLMREALACGAQHSGITDVSDATSPRLERFRAARLVPGKVLDVDNYRLVTGTSDAPISVGGRH